MIVVTLSNCPPALRGDLTKWLSEIDTGVYVGQAGVRVRDELWKRIKEYATAGRAVMVFNAANEQGLDFRIHNASWEPIDFDGLKLMLRPNATRLANRQRKSIPKQGFSNASRNHMARKMYGRRSGGASAPVSLKNYVVIDIETTGLSAANDEIIELAALRVIGGKKDDHYQALVKPDRPVPPDIETLTGITAEALDKEGRALSEALPEFIEFIGDHHMIAHNAEFDIGFIKHACDKMGILTMNNLYTDTLALARQKVHGVTNHKLSTLLEHFGIESERIHRGLSDCIATHMLYVKLNEIED